MKTKIKKDIPQFIWSTGDTSTKKYGPYKKGDEVELPKEVVEALKAYE